MRRGVGWGLARLSRGDGEAVEGELEVPFLLFRHALQKHPVRARLGNVVLQHGAEEVARLVSQHVCRSSGRAVVHQSDFCVDARVWGAGGKEDVHGLKRKD